MARKLRLPVRAHGRTAPSDGAQSLHNPVKSEMQGMPAGREIRALTGLRGVAAVYVMLFHYVIGLPFSNAATTFIGHGYLAVDLFFVLSGFVMALNYGRMFEAGWSATAHARFLGRRIARVYPLYVVATICGCVLVAMGYLEAPQFPLLSTFVLNLLMVQSWGLTGSLDGPAWSISAEWAAYLLFPAMLVPCLLRRPRWAWTSAAVCIAVIAGLCTLPQSWAHRPTPATLIDLHDPHYGLPVLRCLAEFALGLLAFRLRSTSSFLAVVHHHWIAAALCCATILLMTIPNSDFAVVLLFPMLVLSLTSDRHLPARLLCLPGVAFLGRLSYSIYLTHDLMGGVLNAVHGLAEGWGLRHAQTYAAAVGVLLTFPCSYLAYTVIEVPGRRWLRVLFERTRPSSIAVEPSAP